MIDYIHKHKTILICPDSFKESINSLELTQKLASFLENYKTICIPYADGGEGSLLVLEKLMPLHKRTITISNAFTKPQESYYLHSKDNKEAFIELAMCSGLGLIPYTLRDPSVMYTGGVAELILDALNIGCEKINLFVGGSSSNDAGIGIADLLGVGFYTEGTKIHLPKGIDMNAIDEIKLTNKIHNRKFDLVIIHDVDNPFVGPKGAVHCFAKQKGANKEILDILESGMFNMMRLFESTYGVKIDNLSGAGAAGGIAGGLVAMLDAKLINGFDYFARLTGLEEKIKNVDLIITGEGRIDNQSIQSKMVSRICKLAKNNNKKVFTIAGEISLTDSELTQMGVVNTIELKSFGNDLEINRKNTLFQIEKAKNSFLKKIEAII